LRLRLQSFRSENRTGPDFETLCSAFPKISLSPFAALLVFTKGYPRVFFLGGL
jgi:hypothetical protein